MGAEGPASPGAVSGTGNFIGQGHQPQEGSPWLVAWGPVPAGCDHAT